MIALSHPFTGNLHGLRGADLQCYREARASGYTTTFRAMLSSNVQDLVRIVHSVDADTPIVNVAGHHLFPSWRSFVNGAQMNANAKLLSFDRHDVLNDSRWWVETGKFRSHEKWLKINFPVIHFLLSQALIKLSEKNQKIKKKSTKKNFFFLKLEFSENSTKMIPHFKSYWSPYQCITLSRFFLW